jgi:hypothetical protein
MAKTTKAHGVRGARTPEQEAIATVHAATRKAEALSSRLDHLTEIVKLAAFAAEARRTLTAVYDVMHFIPNMKEVISNCAAPANQWSSLEDNAGGVLVYVAMELQDVNNDFLEQAYDLARLSSPSEAAQQAAKKGGAA